MNPWQTISLCDCAPAKPEQGAPCNGCGICCAAEPCPMAILFLFQFRGACRALFWQKEEHRYVCGLVVSPESYIRWLPHGSRPHFSKFVASRIASGEGCDISAEVADAPH